MGGGSQVRVGHIDEDGHKGRKSTPLLFTLARLRAPCVDSAHGTQGIALQWLQNSPSGKGAIM
eukprot:796449-Alexandrium_andersonii.AAC.1